MRRSVLSTIIDRNCESIVSKNGLGVVDGGASGLVIVDVLAQQLLGEGLISSITACKEGDISISWGDGEAVVIGIAQSCGLLQDVYNIAPGKKVFSELMSRAPSQGDEEEEKNANGVLVPVHPVRMKQSFVDFFAQHMEDQRFPSSQKIYIPYQESQPKRKVFPRDRND